MATEATPYYEYQLIKKVWTGQLRQTPQRFIGEDYFDNFILQHGSFKFCIVRIYDGTSQLMLDKEQYQIAKKRLEGKTKVSLNEITSRVYLGATGNVLDERKSFSSQRELDRELRDLKENENLVYKRACQKASQQKTKLRQMFSEKRNAKFISFNLEVDKKNLTTILQIRYVKFALKEGDKPEYFHAIVNKDPSKQEGFNSSKEKSRFGTTSHMSLREAAAFLKRGVARSDALVTHSGYNHDDKCLTENGIILPEKIIFDTQTLALVVLPPQVPTIVFWDLARILEELNIAYDESTLQNAGNDAYYTMLAFKALARRAMPEICF